MALSVPHKDLENPSLDISVLNNKVSAHRAIMVADAYIDTAITELGGTSIAVGGIVTRLDPDSFPGLGYLIVSNISSISLDEYLGLGCVGPLNSYGIPTDPNGYRVLLVDYETPTYQTGSAGPQDQNGPYFTTSRQAHNEVVSIPKDGLMWEKSANDFWDKEYHGLPDELSTEEEVAVKEVRSAFGGNIMRTDVRLIWHRVSSPDFNTIKTLVGTCNLDQIFDGAPSTVLFEGLRDQRQIMYSGDLVWEIEYAFSVREVKFQDEDGNLLVGGWNHFPRSDPADQDQVDNDVAEPGSQYPWQKLLFKKTGKPLIPEVAWPAATLFAVLPGQTTAQ